MAFEHCFNLTNITIPASVQNIGYRAFCDCKKLTDVYYGNTKDNWNSISIGEFNEGLTNATVHYASIVITTATCEEDGVEKYACTECDSCYVTKVLEKATGHDMSSFVETLVPTCTEIGEERSYCSRCNHFETRDIIATGHDYETVVIKPTCTEKGYTTYTCHCNDTYIADEVDALGHDMSDFAETLAPTCTEMGEERSACSRCDYFETRDIIAIGHDYETVVTKPTCTEKGYTTYTCHCSDLLCMR